MLFAPDWKRDTAHLGAGEPPPAQAMFARWVIDLLARGQNDEALRRAEIGTSQYPGYATGWYALARAQAACGELADAATAAERCLAIEPDFFAAWDLLADLWARLNRPASAKAARARRDEFLIEVAGTPAAETIQGTDAVKTDTGAATATPSDTLQDQVPPPQKLVIKRPPETVKAFETPTLAELYRRQGLLDRALDVYRKILDRHPNDRGAKSMIEKLEAELASKQKPAGTS